MINLKNINEIEAKIVEIVDKIRPFLISDGGNIEFIKFENGIAYVKMMGHCQGCPMMDMTLKDSIETAIVNEIPEVIEVRNIE